MNALTLASNNSLILAADADGSIGVIEFTDYIFVKQIKPTKFICRLYILKYAIILFYTDFFNILQSGDR